MASRATRHTCGSGGDAQGGLSFSDAAALYRTLAAARPDIAEYRVRPALLALRSVDERPAREALAWLDALEGEALRRALPPVQLRYWGTHEGWLALTRARLLVQLGEQGPALESLRAAADRGLLHTYLHLHDDPDFEALRADAGFQRLLRPRE